MKTILSILLILVLAINIFYHTVHIRNKYKANFPVDFEPGLQFNMMTSWVKDNDTIGYITDSATSREKNDGIYLQAQYFLAPVIIELDAEDHQYTIIDSVNFNYLVPTIRRLNAWRVVNNEYGQALLKKK